MQNFSFLVILRTSLWGLHHWSNADERNVSFFTDETRSGSAEVRQTEWLAMYSTWYRSWIWILALEYNYMQGTGYAAMCRCMRLWEFTPCYYASSSLLEKNLQELIVDPCWSHCSCAIRLQSMYTRSTEYIDRRESQTIGSEFDIVGCCDASAKTCRRSSWLDHAVCH